MIGVGGWLAVESVKEKNIETARCWEFVMSLEGLKEWNVVGMLFAALLQKRFS